MKIDNAYETAVRSHLEDCDCLCHKLHNSDECFCPEDIEEEAELLREMLK